MLRNFPRELAEDALFTFRITYLLFVSSIRFSHQTRMLFPRRIFTFHVANTWKRIGRPNMGHVLNVDSGSAGGVVPYRLLATLGNLIITWLDPINRLADAER